MDSTIKIKEINTQPVTAVPTQKTVEAPKTQLKSKYYKSPKDTTVTNSPAVQMQANDTEVSNTNAEDYWGQKNAEALDLQAVREKNADKYQMNLPDSQYDFLNQHFTDIANTYGVEAAEDERYKYMNAMQYSRLYGVTLEEAMQNVDNYNKALFGEQEGKDYKTKCERLGDSWTMGTNTIERSNLGVKLMEAEKNGDTELASQLWEAIDALDKQNELLAINQPQAIGMKILTAGIQSLPYTAAVGAAGFVSGMIGAGPVGSFAMGARLTQADSYIDLRQKNVDQKLAEGLSAANGVVQATIENVLGLIAGKAVQGAKVAGKPYTKEISDVVADKIAKDFCTYFKISDVGVKSLVHATTKAGADVFGEGAEEFFQDWSDTATNCLAKAFSSNDVDIEDFDLEKSIKSSLEAFKGGFYGAIMLGAPNIAFDAAVDVKEYKKLRDDALTIPSREVFKETTKNNKVFDEMSPEEINEAQDVIYDNLEKDRDAAMEADVAESVDVSANVEGNVTDETGERLAKGTEYRTDDGELATEKTTGNDGKNYFLVGDTTRSHDLEEDGNRYGYIEYSENGNNVTINQFKMAAGRENIAKEFYRDFAEQFAGKNITWNPKQDTNLNLKKQIIEENPAGKKAGLNYFKDTASVAEVKNSVNIAKQLREALPRATTEQIGGSVAIVKAVANAQGITTDELLSQFKDKKIVTNEKTAELIQGELQQQKNSNLVLGAHQFDKAGKAIIYVAKNADMNTFVHEFAHHTENFLTQDQRQQVLSALGHDAWSVKTSESFADGLVDYLRTGKTDKKGLEDIFAKVAQMIGNVIRGLQGTIKLSKELTDVYDSLMKDDGSGLAKAMKAAVEADVKLARRDVNRIETKVNEQQTTETNESEKTQSVTNEEEDLTEKTADEIKEEAATGEEAKEQLEKKAEETINDVNTSTEEKADASQEAAGESFIEGLGETDPLFQLAGLRGVRALKEDEFKKKVVIEFRAAENAYANLNILEKLKDPKQKLEAENAIKGIAQLTGWQLRNDSWVYEFDDSSYKFKDPEKIRELFALPLNVLTEMQKTNQAFIEDILDAEDLYKFYPAARRVPLNFIRTPGEYKAIFDKDGITINLNMVYSTGDLMTALKGELQHFIQGIEVKDDSYNTYTMSVLAKNEKQHFSFDWKNFPQQFRKYLFSTQNILERNFDIQAAKVEARGNMTAAERRAQPTLFQIIGEKGALELDRVNEVHTLEDNWNVAKEMEKAGKDAKTIRIATGWERGVEGKWRYETDDIDTSKIIGLLQEKIDKGEAPVITGDLSEYTNIPNLYGQDVLLRIELNTDTSRINLQLGGYEEGSEGDSEHFGKAPEINLTINKLDELNTVLPHEVQHFIQNMEGFAAGGNLNSIDTELEAQKVLREANSEAWRIHTLRQILEQSEEYKNVMSNENITPFDVEDELNKIDLYNNWKEAVKDFNETYYDAGISTEKYNEETGEYNKFNAERLRDDYENFEKEFLKNYVREHSFDNYQRIAGEVEARNVETRRNYTAEQRLNTLLRNTEDIDRDQQIILYQTLSAEAAAEIAGQEREVRDQYENTDQWLKAPNGEDTNLTEEQWVQTRTKNFKKWFGDWENDPENSSKVVDENGEPMVMYHGTYDNFDVFDSSKTRANMDIQGNFFSPWELDAKGYGPNVYKVFLNIRNPADGGTGYAALHAHQGENYAGVKAREDLRAKGYDGLNNYDEEYVTFDPNQIKSATDNSGEFNTENPSILYQTTSKEELATLPEYPELTKEDYIREWEDGDYFDELEAKRKAVMDAYRSYINNPAFVGMHIIEGDQQKFIHKSPRNDGEGKWQMSLFDQWGPYSHVTFDDISEAETRGYSIPLRPDSVTVTYDNEIRYDRPYYDAIENNNMEKAAAILREYADSVGYKGNIDTEVTDNTDIMIPPSKRFKNGWYTQEDFSDSDREYSLLYQTESKQEKKNWTERDNDARSILAKSYSESERNRILANFDRLYMTPWHKQAIESILIRADMEQLLAGKEMTHKSKLGAPTAADIVEAIKDGKEGITRYLKVKGIIGSTDKAVNCVNSDFQNCDPSEECAKYCYAATGTHAFPAPAVKAALVTYFIENNPEEAAKMTYNEYSVMLEYEAGKALRLFDKGDISEKWLPYIEALNKKGIKTQIFSKRPAILRRVDPENNVIMLSIDKSNIELMNDPENADLPVAFVYSGIEDIKYIEANEARFKKHGGVILPVKIGDEVLEHAAIEALPLWARPYCCPVDSGHAVLNYKNKENEGKPLWNCLRCNSSGGIGCFYHRVTTVRAQLEKLDDTPLNERDYGEIENEVRELEETLKSGKISGIAEAVIRKELASLISQIRKGYDPEAERGSVNEARSVLRSESGNGTGNNGEIKYQLVTDPEEIKRLESEPTVKAYRAAQLIDGKLYPPMSAKVNGVLRDPIELNQWERSDENPELADDNGMYKLNKGNGSSILARYNPYFHSSPTMLNDQFSSAQDRDNLVTLEVEIPLSELNSAYPYKAFKAKDAVGTKQWKAGIIQAQLTGTREVNLSRWDKPVRIVPDEEVAENILKTFAGIEIVMPSNVVPPSIRKELEKKGVKFVETTNKGILKEGPYAGVHYSKVYGTDNNLLLQTTKELYDQARSFESWEDFKNDAVEYASWAGHDETNDQIPEDANDAWYKETWEKAQQIGDVNEYNDDYADKVKGETSEENESVKDKQWYDEITSDMDMLKKFIRELSYALDVHKDVPQDYEEQQLFNKQADLRDRFYKEVAGDLKVAALEAHKVDPGEDFEISDKVKKGIFTQLKNHKRDYRDLYSDFTGDEDWEVPTGFTQNDTIAVRIGVPVEETYRYTPKEKQAIIDRLDFEDIKKEIKDGTFTMDDDRITKLMRGYEQDIDKLNQKIEAMKKQEDEDALLNVKQTAALEKLYQERLEKQERQEQLHNVRDIKVRLVKDVNKKVDFKTINYDEGRKIIAIQALWEDRLGKYVNDFINQEGQYIRDAYSLYKTDASYRSRIQSLAARDSDLGGKGSKALSKVVNLFETKSFDKWTKEERQFVAEHLPLTNWIKELGLEELSKERKGALQLELQSEEVQNLLKETLPEDLLALLSQKELKNWTLEQMEDLTKVVNDLRKEGREKLQVKQEARQQAADNYRLKIEKALRDSGIRINSDDTPEEKDKKSKQIKAFNKKVLGVDNAIKGTLEASSKRQTFLNRLLHGYSDANVRRVARILDNGIEGVNTTLLYYRENECYNAEQKMIRTRSEKINRVMKENDISLEDLFNKVTVNFADGSGTFTYDELLYFAAANEDDNSRMAVSCGNMYDDTIKSQYRGTPELQQKYQDMAMARYKEVLKAADALPEKFKKLAAAIEKDYGAQYERMNKISIDEWNSPVWRVQHYVPLIRLESNGDTNANRVKQDLLGATTGTGTNWVDKGMTKKRVEISPANQKPVETGLYSTWADSLKRTEHFINYAAYVRELNRVYLNRDSGMIKQLAQNRYGDAIYSYINDYINEVANPDAAGAKTDFDRIIHALRGRTAPAYLSWKMSGIVKQFCTSPWPYMAHISPKEYAAAAFDMTRHYKDLTDAIKSKSEFMNARRYDPIVDLVEEQKQKATNKVTAAISNFENMGMQGLEWIDWACVAPGWLAVYRKEYSRLSSDKEQNKLVEKRRQDLKSYEDVEGVDWVEAEAEKARLTEDQIEKAAVLKADDITRLCQPSNRLTDLAPMFKARGPHSEASRVLLQFTTSLNVIWQNLRYDLPIYARNAEYRKVIGTIAGYTLAGIAMGLVTEGAGGDDNDDDDLKALKQIAYYGTTQFTDAVPLVGSVLSSVNKQLITGDKSYSQGISDMFPLVTKTTTGVTNALKGDWDKACDNWTYAMGLSLGLPVSGVKEAAAVAGIGNNDGELRFYPQALIGRREAKKKN